jgi:serine/threonine protein kinase
MHTPPPPPGEGSPDPRPTPRPVTPDSRDGPALPPAPPTPVPNNGPATDLFVAANPDLTDDTPTVISRTPPRTLSSDDVFSGALRGRRLAHFELIEPIGVGGMAAVIRAQDLQLERSVALKILPPEMAADEENVRRFHQEARAAAKLDHENIARVFFCGEDQRLHFIAFEFVEGQNLRTVLERRGRLPVPEAVNYMLQLTSGLAHAASRGVVHRDIKPSNIIISPNGRAKLVDMGLARSLQPQDDKGLTQSGVTLGTFDYISPEQALEPREADIRSDIYSLGCTFYHALTGQPPVPEGTAAKKLHHHQHVDPIDPRQLNPDIPDDVAAILVKMMAKDPKVRYQKAEHLFQHLMVVAQKLGGVADARPDGVVFMDAPLPNPPRPRPVVMAVAATVILLVLVWLLGQASHTPPPPVAGDQVSGAVPGTGKDNPRPQSPSATGEPLVVKTAPAVASPPSDNPPPRVYDPDHPNLADLTRFVRESSAFPLSTVTLKDDLNLTPTGEDALKNQDPGLVFGKEGMEGSETLIIQGSGQQPLIRLASDPTRAPSHSRTSAALTVKGGIVYLKKLRFLIDARQTLDTYFAALNREGGRIIAEDCLFIQALPSQSGGRLSAVEVGGTAGPAVTLTRCGFMAVQDPEKLTQVDRGGQYALTVTAPATVSLTDCCFGPHAALIAFQGDARGRPDGAHVDLNHCSALLGADSAVCRLENAGACRLDVNNSLFSHPGPEAVAESTGAALVRQVDDLAGGFVYTGHNNRYHNLDVFWARPLPLDSLFWLDKFKEEVKKGQGSDSSSQVLPLSPWINDDPLKLLEKLESDNLCRAFQVNAALPQLRPRDGDRRLVGLDRCFWVGEGYSKNLPDLKETKPDKVAARKERVVVPGKSDSAKGIYESLSAALEGINSGDVVLIQHTGLMKVAPIRLVKPMEVTIRADQGYHPVLTLADAEEEDAFLFRVQDGKLRLEGLGFELRPTRAEFKSQTVVSAVGDGECLFKDCALTLDPAGMGVALAAVTVADPPGVMKMNPQPVRPAGQRFGLTLKNCLVRGDGDLLRCTSARPFDLEAEGTLAALTGSFLNVEGGGDDAPAAPAGALANVRLARVTAYLTGHLVRMRAGRELKGLVPVHVKPAADCLFVAAGGKALVHLDGPDTSEDRMKALFLWEGHHNAYSRFTDMLDQQPRDVMDMRPPPYDKEKWKGFTGESDGVFKGVALADPPSPDESLVHLGPARFRVKADPDQQGYGADIDPLEKLLTK